MAQETQLRNVLRIMSALASLVSMVIFVFVLIAFRAGEERQRLGLEATVKALDSLQQNVAAMRISIDNSAKNLTAVDATFSKVQSQVNSLEAKVVDAQKANAATNQQLPQIARSIEDINRMMAAELPRPLIEAPQLLDAGATGGKPTATKPAQIVPEQFSLMAILRTMPDNLKERNGESQRTTEARRVWIDEHVKGKHIKVSFLVTFANDTTVQSSYNGNAIDFQAVCEFSKENPLKEKVYAKDSVVIEGDISEVDALFLGTSEGLGLPGSPSIRRGKITLTKCKVVSLVKGK